MRLSEIDTRSVSLERLQVRMAQRVGRSMMASASVETWSDLVVDELVFGLTSYVLSEKLQETVQVVEHHFDYWATPWQHWKATAWDSVLTRWVRRRWPPVKVRIGSQRTVVRFERNAVYPHANIAVPPLGKPVIIETIRKDDE